MPCVSLIWKAVAGQRLGEQGWFLFSKISEFPIVHVPKLFPLLHRFQNYFCFCSWTFPSHGSFFDYGNFNGKMAKNHFPRSDLDSWGDFRGSSGQFFPQNFCQNSEYFWEFLTNFCQKFHPKKRVIAKFATKKARKCDICDPKKRVIAALTDSRQKNHQNHFQARPRPIEINSVKWKLDFST